MDYLTKKFKMNLVIVESPAKCSKIQGFLGSSYIVKATMGHIRGLEENLESVGIENDWTPTYAELPTKKDAIIALKKAAKGNSVILATDDDREGEGIAWHVCMLLKLNPATTPRIVFHEITKGAILTAVANPRRLDLNKVNAQQARAMLDLLVGFTISRVLWIRVAPKLSAGRCQTPALTLVAERDEEIENHKASSFWRLSGSWITTSGLELEAEAINELEKEADVTLLLKNVVGKTISTVKDIKETISISQPPKPLITSTLQQEASSLYGIQPKSTMQAAQKLYEAGHITYMRTDNAIICSEAADTIRNLIINKYGNEFVGNIGPMKPEKKKKKDTPEAQAAHEAIRPTHPEIEEIDTSDSVQRTIYRLIWRRTIQSQMSASQTDVRKIHIEIDSDKSTYYVSEFSKVKFSGYKIIELKPEKISDDIEKWNKTNSIRIGSKLNWIKLFGDEHFTKAKARFTEASLIAELEKRGIGRPSTFASLVSTIIDREYVEKTNIEGEHKTSKKYILSPQIWPPMCTLENHKTGNEKNKLRSTPLGRSVCSFLKKEYNDLFNYEFTSYMETQLDKIVCGEVLWKSLLQTTWDTYKERYKSTIATKPKEAKAGRERILGEGMKVVQSKKGPLFVREIDGEKTQFAPLQSTQSFESVNLENAEQAFSILKEQINGDLIGELDSEEIRKRKGPYGFYIKWRNINIPYKEEPLEETIKRLKIKADPENTYNRKVGQFTIRKGPYGLYFFKHELKKPRFTKLPDTFNPEKVSEKELMSIYSTPKMKKSDNKMKKVSDNNVHQDN